MSKVIISADSTCDIGPALAKKHHVQLLHWRIVLEGREYVDNIEITPDDLYEAWWARKVLPKSSGAVPSDYERHFAPFLEKGYEIVHLNLGSGISCAYQNCCTTAKEHGHIYPVDSQNLSTGFGHLVIQAALLAQQGMAAPDIQSEIQGMCGRAHGSFLLDSLEFMRAGGRCGTISLLGANLLKIKPCIEVDNQNGGRMQVGKKYRGTMESCLRQYVHDTLAGREDIDLERVFITHSGSPESDIQAVKEEIAGLHDFKEMFVTRANGVISTHCGPRTLGVLYMTQ